VDFSYIWIANSPQGTVSKIATQTLTEVGRYTVRPQGGGQPSRTSVSLNGDVVVASRDGGVTKILAGTDGCLDDNGTPGIQTSTGTMDGLAWDEEECVAWYTDYSFVSERAIAWTAGELNRGTCQHEGAKVWVGATADSVNLEIMRLNGDTGVEEDKVVIPGTTGLMSRSPYGGAVDQDGDFWVVNTYCDASLVEIRDDLTYGVFGIPAGLCAYGLAVDSNGMIWIGGYTGISARYDPVNQVWDTVQAQGLGIQEDAEGRMWLGAYQQNGVYAIDSVTMQVLDYVDIPVSQTKGISIDFFGYVWVVADSGTTAARLDPVTKDIQLYEGLDSPYSYSDMTGWGLKNVSDPQG
jgi:ligand-binding sensor domain-containing protein